MARLIALALSLPLILSCDSTFDASRLDNNLVNTSWIFEKAETADGDVVPLATASRLAEIVFGSRAEDGNAFEVNGYNGCNAFSADYIVGGDNELKFSRILQTERACMPGEARIEEVFNRGIHGALRYGFDGSVLEIEAPNEAVTLRFLPVLAE